MKKLMLIALSMVISSMVFAHGGNMSKRSYQNNSSFGNNMNGSGYRDRDRSDMMHENTGQGGYGSGMMNGQSGNGVGMMNGQGGYGSGMMNGQSEYGSGMMDGQSRYGSEMMNGNGAPVMDNTQKIQSENEIKNSDPHRR